MKYTLAELEGVEDLELQSSGWITVDQARIDGFAEVTEDHQWIHTDPERAGETPFGSTIAHGYLLISLLPKLLDEIFVVSDAQMMVNFGFDKVRFIQPVREGAEICLRAKIEKATWRKGNLLLRIRGSLFVRPAGSDAKGRRSVALETLFLAVPPEDETE